MLELFCHAFRDNIPSYRHLLFSVRAEEFFFALDTAQFIRLHVYAFSPLSPTRVVQNVSDLGNIAGRLSRLGYNLYCARHIGPLMPTYSKMADTTFL